MEEEMSPLPGSPERSGDISGYSHDKLRKLCGMLGINKKGSSAALRERILFYWEQHAVEVSGKGEEKEGCAGCFCMFLSQAVLKCSNCCDMLLLLTGTGMVSIPRTSVNDTFAKRGVNTPAAEGEEMGELHKFLPNALFAHLAGIAAKAVDLVALLTVDVSSERTGASIPLAEQEAMGEKICCVYAAFLAKCAHCTFGRSIC
ncbi:MAG: hypothetical protein ACRDL7_01355 [Gaiellaceae bacterium]